jgi:hypothetical protein
MYFSDYSGVSCGHFQFLYLHRLRIMFSQVKGAIPVRSWRLAPQLSRVCAQAGAGFAQVIHRCVHREIAVRGPGQGRGTPGGSVSRISSLAHSGWIPAPPRTLAGESDGELSGTRPGVRCPQPTVPRRARNPHLLSRPPSRRTRARDAGRVPLAR